MRRAWDQIGPYRVERELGGGGQAVVYLAEDSRLNRKVALKVLPRGAAVSRRRFEREAEAAGRLNDPGICTVHDVGVDRGALYIAMRLGGPGRGALDADATERDSGVMGNDCAHVFLVPPGAPALALEPQPERWYFHLTVNPIGTQRDAVGYMGKVWWDGRWSAKTSVREGPRHQPASPPATLGLSASAASREAAAISSAVRARE